MAKGLGNKRKSQGLFNRRPPPVGVALLVGATFLAWQTFRNRRDPAARKEPSDDLVALPTYVLVCFGAVVVGYRQFGLDHLPCWELNAYGTCTRPPAERLLVCLQYNENSGMEVHISPLGCIVQRLLLPDKGGTRVDVVLGFDDLQPYSVCTDNIT
jgi:hypothetical protein